MSRKCVGLVVAALLFGLLGTSVTPAFAAKKGKKQATETTATKREKKPARERGERRKKEWRNESFDLYPGVDAKMLGRSLAFRGPAAEVRASGIVRDINHGHHWVIMHSRKYGTWKVYISSNAALIYSGGRVPFGHLGGGAYISVIGRKAGPHVIVARHVDVHSGVIGSYGNWF